MSKRKREQFGPFVITKVENIDPNYVICAMCKKRLAAVQADDIVPTFEELEDAGAVPIPNFGWFCSQNCANAYSKEFNIAFQRNAAGEVSYDP